MEFLFGQIRIFEYSMPNCGFVEPHVAIGSSNRIRDLPSNIRMFDECDISKMKVPNLGAILMILVILCIAMSSITLIMTDYYSF
jgi:hypothetical protein